MTLLQRRPAPAHIVGLTSGGLFAGWHSGVSFEQNWRSFELKIPCELSYFRFFSFWFPLTSQLRRRMRRQPCLRSSFRRRWPECFATTSGPGWPKMRGRWLRSLPKTDLSCRTETGGEGTGSDTESLRRCRRFAVSASPFLVGGRISRLNHWSVWILARRFRHGQVHPGAS